MAKRPARARSSPAGAARRKSAAPPAGPVTLAQARALAKLAVPLPKGGKAALVPASPASVGVERRKLELKQEQERRRRIREYKATLAIMKKRGVKGLGPKKKKGGPAPKAPPKPLQVFAEGDSWFDYPVPFFGGGIIPRLENKLGVPMLNLAKAGDEVRYMLGREGAQAAHRAVHQRLPRGRAVGRDAVLGRRQRHRRRPDGAVDPRLQRHACRRRRSSTRGGSMRRWRWSAPATRTSSGYATA